MSKRLVSLFKYLLAVKIFVGCQTLFAMSCADFFSGNRNSIQANPIEERISYQHQAITQGIDIEAGIGRILESNRDTRLIAIGETHGNPNQHLDYIRSIKAARPDVDTVFIEVSHRINPLLAGYFIGNVRIEAVMSEVKRNHKLRQHLTPEILSVCKELGLRIVGVEMYEGTIGLSNMMDLAVRNKFTAEEIEKYFNYEQPEEVWRQNMEREQGWARANSGIYIGGSGHLQYRNQSFSSVTDMLDIRGIKSVKILALDDKSSVWDMSKLGVRDYVPPHVKHDFSFLPRGRTPLLLPSLPILDTKPTYWTEYDLIIVRKADELP